MALVPLLLEAKRDMPTNLSLSLWWRGMAYFFIIFISTFEMRSSGLAVLVQGSAAAIYVYWLVLIVLFLTLLRILGTRYFILLVILLNARSSINSYYLLKQKLYALYKIFISNKSLFAPLERSHSAFYILFLFLNSSKVR